MIDAKLTQDTPAPGETERTHQRRISAEYLQLLDEISGITRPAPRRKRFRLLCGHNHAQYHDSVLYCSACGKPLS